MKSKLCIAIVVLPMFASAQVASPPAFEVASVRPSQVSAVRDKKASYFRYTPQGVEAGGFDLLGIIGRAYEIPVARISIRDARLRNVLDATYDLNAKAEQVASTDQLRWMLQTLLVERFKLTLHHESRKTSVYRLVLAKRGPRLPKPVAGDGKPLANRLRQGGFSFDHFTMAQFCQRLTAELGQPVLDATGIGGAYTFDLIVDVIPRRQQAGVNADFSSSTIFTDIQEQLGLQLVADKAPIRYLIVDHAERPSEN